MDSDRRIMLSNCLTVIRHEDLAAPVASRCLKRLYSSTMNSAAFSLICEEIVVEIFHFYNGGHFVGIRK